MVSEAVQPNVADLFIIGGGINGCGIARDELARALQTRNIGISLHYRPLHRMTYWAAFTHARFPAADAYFDRCLTLPLFMDMSEAEVDYVVAALTEILS